MATKKISELNALTTPESDDLIAIVDASATETKKITYGNISKHIVNVGTEVEEDSRINFIHSRNLFDKNNVNVLNAYFVDGTNNITADTSGNNKTIYIPCKPNTTYTIQKTASPSNRAIGYTTTTPSVGVAVQGATNISANTTTGSITTGNNARYLVIRVWSGSQDTITYEQMLASVQIEEGDTATSYEPYVTKSIVVDNTTFTETLKVGTNVDGKSRVNVLKSKNLFTSEVEQGAINANVGSTYVNVKSSNATRIRTTDLIRLDKTKSYTISCKTDYNVVLQAFNDNQLLYVVDGTTNTWVSSKTFSNIPYIAISIKKSDNSNITPSEINNAEVMLEVGTSASTYEDYIVPSINVDGETFTDTLKVGTNVDSRSRVNVLKSKNLFDISKTLENTTIGSNGTISINSGTNIYYIPIEYDKNYIMSFIDNGTGGNVVWGFSNSIPTIGGSSTYNVNTCPQLNNKVFTAPSSSNKYLCIRLATGGGQLSSMSNVQIEQGSTATTYEPYIVPSINVDGEEIYKYNVLQNGKGTWTHSSINYGSVFYHTIGNLVILNISDLQVSSNITSLSTRTKIASGLPRNGSPLATSEFGILNNFNNGSTAYTVRVIVDESGDLYLNYSNLNTSQRYYGVIVYTTTD